MKPGDDDAKVILIGTTSDSASRARVIQEDGIIERLLTSVSFHRATYGWMDGWKVSQGTSKTRSQVNNTASGRGEPRLLSVK